MPCGGCGRRKKTPNNIVPIMTIEVFGNKFNVSSLSEILSYLNQYATQRSKVYNIKVTVGGKTKNSRLWISPDYRVYIDGVVIGKWETN